MATGYCTGQVRKRTCSFSGCATSWDGKPGKGPMGSKESKAKGCLAGAQRMSVACFLILSKAGQQGQCRCLLLHPQKVCASQVFLGKFSFCLSFLILFKKPTGYSSQYLIMFFPALLGNRALKFPSHISPSGPCLCFIETLPRNELMDRLSLARGK